jgi:citronellyl-CoA dehydrogenase
MSQIVIPADVKGFEVSRKLDKLGMRSSDTALLTFDDMRVPRSNLIGIEGRGFQQQMQQFQSERMIAAYNGIGAIGHALSLTKEYVRERKAFGAPLAANQYLSFTLAELAAEHRAFEALCQACAAAYIRGEDTTRDTTICKLIVGRLVRKVADWCMQFHGGIGYMEETWTARFLRDARLWGIGGGADEVMLRTLARAEGFLVD